MEITVNREQVECAAGTTLQMLVEQGGYAQGPVAVAINHEVVPRAAWASTALKAGDAVSIISAAMGG